MQSSLHVNEAIHTLNVGREQPLVSHKPVRLSLRVEAQA